MRRKRVLVSAAGLILFLFLSNVAAAGEVPSAKGPKAVLPETLFEFQPVLEDTQVVHKFILKNDGDKPLTILDLRAG